MYKLDYTDEAMLDMQRLKRDEPKAFQKLGKLATAPDNGAALSRGDTD